ncbi:Cof-type HAD-IIB family hydrolase [Conservatibacter flavescens]|uniref:Cof-type HAD-IIB family hydrolase n=1 Tax=Conservatibacter flavescens TaxID=28161 RepID=A0A2M8S302_9PAST|nr:Cof-type HAD-IIB family hydrolase [Conservatibacter flavescens]PJG85533.1 Cof-type HAD-IIB family hydrolase [Conservatibacter flavescens]
MQNLPFRAIVSDLDGTLLNANHVIGEFTIDTLAKLAQKNVDIILATGRNHTDVMSILDKINVKNAAMITSNGARIHDLQGSLLYSNNLEEKLAFEIMNMPFDATRVCVNSYQDEGWFINIDIPALRKYHQDSGFMYDVVDFRHHHGRGTEKVFFIGKTAEDLIELEQALKTRFGEQTAITFSTPNCLEVMNKNVSKGTALTHLLASRDYTPQDCIAFGDGMNDVEMLQEVGKGCVMFNADPRLKQACPTLEQIGLNKDEAVASYIRAIFGIYQ